MTRLLKIHPTDRRDHQQDAVFSKHFKHISQYDFGIFIEHFISNVTALRSNCTLIMRDIAYRQELDHSVFNVKLR